MYDAIRFLLAPVLPIAIAASLLALGSAPGGHEIGSGLGAPLAEAEVLVDRGLPLEAGEGGPVRPVSPERGAHTPSPDESAMGMARDRDVFLSWVDRLRQEGERATVAALVDWVGSSRARLDLLIDHASDEEITEVIARLTNLDRERLGDERDLQAYARKLGRIAMAHLPDVDGTVPRIDGGTAIEITETVFADRSAASPRANYGEAAGRIYGVFPTSVSPGESVYAKWYERGSNEVLHLGEYAVEEGTGSSFVWLEPEEGWPAGDYGVDLYADVETPTPIASGGFFVR